MSPMVLLVFVGKSFSLQRCKTISPAKTEGLMRWQIKH